MTSLSQKISTKTASIIIFNYIKIFNFFYAEPFKKLLSKIRSQFILNKITRNRLKKNFNKNLCFKVRKEQLLLKWVGLVAAVFYVIT